MIENFSFMAKFIWSATDHLRGNFKKSQYGRVILPLDDRIVATKVRRS